VLAGQAGWLLGAAVVGALGLLAVSRLRRTDPRTGWLLLVGGAFLTTAVVFSRAKGIFHPYYVSLMAPFAAALVGAATAVVLGRGALARLAGPAAVVACVLVQLSVLRERPGSLAWWPPLLTAGGVAVAAGLATVPAPRARALVVAAAIGVLGLAPGAWAAETDGHKTSGTFPIGGPAVVNARIAARPPSGTTTHHPMLSLDRALAYARRHGGGAVAVPRQSGAAAWLITLRAADVVGIGGFSGRETQVTTGWLAGAVRAGKVRYALANRASTRPQGGRIGAADVLAAVRVAGKPVRAVPGLYDLHGRARLLAAL
jgi:4-amino-4-deoxy-L-arabinose transferase-like glycosyltransferase